MVFFDNFNLILLEILALVGRIFPFIFCFTIGLMLFLNLIGMFARWIRWRFIWHCKEAIEDDK